MEGDSRMAARADVLLWMCILSAQVSAVPSIVRDTQFLGLNDFERNQAEIIAKTTRTTHGLCWHVGKSVASVTDFLEFMLKMQRSMRKLLEDDEKRGTALSRSSHQLKHADQKSQEPPKHFPLSSDMLDVGQEDIEFDPRNSSVYDPLKSKTFSYADETHLKGFQSKDVVKVKFAGISRQLMRNFEKLGDYFVETKFGSVTECNSPVRPPTSCLLALNHCGAL
eukprot:764641-Hanusia_phi.AAC.2